MIYKLKNGAHILKAQKGIGKVAQVLIKTGTSSADDLAKMVAYEDMLKSGMKIYDPVKILGKKTGGLESMPYRAYRGYTTSGLLHPAELTIGSEPWSDKAIAYRKGVEAEIKRAQDIKEQLDVINKNIIETEDYLGSLNKRKHPLLGYDQAREIMRETNSLNYYRLKAKQLQQELDNIHIDTEIFKKGGTIKLQHAATKIPYSSGLTDWIPGAQQDLENIKNYWQSLVDNTEKGRKRKFYEAVAKNAMEGTSGQLSTAGLHRRHYSPMERHEQVMATRKLLADRGYDISPDVLYKHSQIKPILEYIQDEENEAAMEQYKQQHPRRYAILNALMNIGIPDHYSFNTELLRSQGRWNEAINSAKSDSINAALGSILGGTMGWEAASIGVGPFLGRLAGGSLFSSAAEKLAQIPGRYLDNKFPKYKLQEDGNWTRTHPYETAFRIGAGLWGWGKGSQLADKATDALVAHNMFSRFKLAPDWLVGNEVNARVLGNKITQANLYRTPEPIDVQDPLLEIPSFKTIYQAPFMQRTSFTPATATNASWDKFLAKTPQEQDNIVRYWNGEKYGNFNVLKYDRKGLDSFKRWWSKLK